MKKLLFFALAAAAWVEWSVAADLSQFKTADDLWKHIQQLQQGPQQEPKSQEEAMKMMGDLLQNMEAALTEFIKSYPDDTRHWEAKLLQVQVTAARARVDGKPTDKEAITVRLKEIADSDKAPAATRGNARFLLIQMHASGLGEEPSAEAVAGLDKEILAFLKQYPDDPRAASLKFLRADLYAKSDAAQSETILKELAADSNPRVARRAKAKLEQKELMKKPLDLKFTAMDGTVVDLAKMRDKVVLVDFWATWCGPCRAEVPNVVAAYKKYREKGFEVVGISLDEEKDAVVKYTQEQGMTWPQHFDGKGWQNEISSRYGIQAIPAMWLVDKKGMVRSTEARGEQLIALIEKLLAE